MLSVAEWLVLCPCSLQDAKEEATDFVLVLKDMDEAGEASEKRLLPLLTMDLVFSEMELPGVRRDCRLLGLSSTDR